MKNIDKLLTLPGNGVFTVHTGKQKKEDLLKAYFGTTDSHKAESLWKKSLKNIDFNQPLVLGIPSDNGGGIQRGANWGPLTIRSEIITEKDSYIDLGDIRVIPHLLHDKYLNSATIKACQKSLYGRANSLPVSPLSISELALEEIYHSNPGAKIFGIGGDHSTSYPLVKTWLASRKKKSRAALLHFDAHTDLLEKRLGIDLCFGTWTFHILKQLASTNHIIQVGIRSSGKTKKYWKDQLGVDQIWANDLSRWGVEKTAKKIITRFKKLNIEEFYISFDIDALDAKYASTTGTPEPDGPSPSDYAALIGLVCQEIKLTGADLMEVAPYISSLDLSSSDRKASLEVAGDMAKLLLRHL